MSPQYQEEAKRQCHLEIADTQSPRAVVRTHYDAFKRYHTRGLQDCESADEDGQEGREKHRSQERRTPVRCIGAPAQVPEKAPNERRIWNPRD